MSTLDPRWQAVRRLLAVRSDNIGDCIMVGPALRALREGLPGAEITLMVGNGAREVASLLPWVDHILPWRSLWQDMGDLPFDPAREFGLIQTLQAQHFDAAVIFTSFAQTPHVAAYACYLAGIPLRLGEPKDFGGTVLSHTPPSPSPIELHQVERNLRLVEAVGFHPTDRSLAVRISREARASASKLLAQHGLHATTPYLLLAPWTSCPARTYTRFGTVARLLQRKTELPIVLTGAPRDTPHGTTLSQEIGEAIDLVGQTTLPELAALVAGAALLLTNNTATMHLAEATGTPQVVLFAGTELEQQWAPRRGPARLLRRDTPCQPCYRFHCPHSQACLDIPPDEVAAAGLELLRSATSRPSRGSYPPPNSGSQGV